MSTNKQLRELANKADSECWYEVGEIQYYNVHHDEDRFICAVSPENILALLDENETLQAECGNLEEALVAIQKASTLKGVHITGAQAGAALGRIAAICDIALEAYHKGGDV